MSIGPNSYRDRIRDADHLQQLVGWGQAARRKVAAMDKSVGVLGASRNLQHRAPLRSAQMDAGADSFTAARTCPPATPKKVHPYV